MKHTYYSKSTNGFYISDVHGIKIEENGSVNSNQLIPDDVVIIDDPLRVSLIEKQSSGMVITHDDDGYPIAKTKEESTSLDNLKAQKKREIELARDWNIKGESSTVTTSNGVLWQTDSGSISALKDAIQLFTSLGSVPEGYEWRDANNTNHPATFELLVEIAALRAVEVNAIWKKSWALKAQVDEINDKAGVSSFVIPNSFIDDPV